MRNYRCPICSKITELPLTKLHPKTFSCPSCLTISKINNYELKFIGQFKEEIENNYTFIGEKIIFQSKTYHVVGISTKRDTSTHEKWNEYIVVDYDGDLFFLSHGSDFNSYLKEFPFKEIENAVTNGRPLSYKTNTYKFDFHQYAETISAQGLFFNNIKSQAFLRTYYNETNDNQFISVEEYDKKTEAFEGNYINSYTFKSLFEKQREQRYLKNNVIKNIVLFFAILSFILGILHYVVNYNNVNSYSYDSYITRNNFVKEIVSDSFKIKGNDQKLKLDFISEVDKKDINVIVSLVNEKTNEHFNGGSFIHFFNSKNLASGNQITFCLLNEGDYHLVFTFNEIGTELNKNYAIDYKITVGGVSLINLYIFIGICFFAGYIYFEGIKNNLKIKETQTFNALLSYNNKTILFLAAGIIVAFLISNYYFVSNKNCNSNLENKSLENATYTGSRSHFIYQTYSNSGSHK
ncbi:DUF4178 domain-containing protein [Flavobacterium sp. I3-2]|uniref:DUF4178 domain-containing protein n=1 Tax=Flavobacterium sp. I3-2 TaxID=2748319 RepID=UPI0015ACC29B|nr:DUF4178 domain-containing protein [Flavobacterium sp. I3-2]